MTAFFCIAEIAGVGMKIASVFWVFLVLANRGVLAADISPYFQADAFFFSEPIGLDGVVNRQKAIGYQGGRQYASIYTESGVRSGHFSISRLYREEYQGRLSDDAADYYQGMQVHQLDPGRQYDVLLEVSHFKAKGMRIAADFKPAENLSVSLGVSALQASQLQHGQLQGNVTANNTGNDHDYQATLKYFYDEDHLLARPDVVAPAGEGYSLDLGVNWKPTANLEISANVRDLDGEIDWRNAPFTDATVTSNVKVIGSDGFVLIKPGLSGKEVYQESFRQKLKPKTDARLKYTDKDTQHSLVLAAKQIPGKTLWGVGAGLPMRGGVANVIAWPEAGVVAVEYRHHKHFSLQLAADSLDKRDLHTFWLGMGWQ